MAARTEKQPLDADFGHKLSFEYLSISILAIASFVSDYIRGSFEEKTKILCLFVENADFGHKLSFEYISPSQPDLAIDNEIFCTSLIVFLEKELFGKFIIVL